MSNEQMTNKKTNLGELARSRRSPRAYESRPVEDYKLWHLFETARWAPSSMNAQPWRFVYAKKEHKEAFNGFLDSLMEGNRIWAQNAPILLAVFARKTYEHNGRAYRHSWYDTGQAMGMLSLQATELDLHIHQMGGFYSDKIREAAGISDEYEPVIMATVGYTGDLNKLPEHLRERELAPRTRKKVDELVRGYEQH